MNTRYLDHLYILLTVALTVYGQLVLKWRIGTSGPLPVLAPFEKIKFLIFLLLDPWILSAFFAAFLASLTWMAAMTKFELSYAYPFMSLNFVFVLAFSGWLLNEPITFQKSAGVLLIVLGTLIIARGQA